MEKVIAEETD